MQDTRRYIGDKKIVEHSHSIDENNDILFKKKKDNGFSQSNSFEFALYGCILIRMYVQYNFMK